MIGAALDLTVIVLLVAAGAYAVRLNRRLEAMRVAQADLGAAIETFDAATRRAESAILLMTSEANARRASRQDAARLIADLGVMVAAGERAAARLETAIHAARADASRAA